MLKVALLTLGSLFSFDSYAGDHCHGPIRGESDTIKIWLIGNDQREGIKYQIGGGPYITIETKSVEDIRKDFRIYEGKDGLKLLINLGDGYHPPHVVTGAIWIEEFKHSTDHDSKNPIALSCEGIRL